MDYIDKMQELLSIGYSKTEVAENLYLNYHSVINTDEVYRIRKRIACDYNCNINDVKLIGSAHTGYTYKDNRLQKRDHPKDYDFAIINANVFVKYFHKVDLDQISKEHKRYYIGAMLNGKIHPYHANKSLLNELEMMNQIIMKDLDVKMHISVCFYISEKAFIEGLVTYNSDLYTGELKRIKEKEPEVNIIEEFEIKEIDKLED
ncbi:MAG: hypothetical protein RRY06_07325 [Lachnospiraceae bacterium]